MTRVGELGWCDRRDAMKNIHVSLVPCAEGGKGRRFVDSVERHALDAEPAWLLPPAPQACSSQDTAVS